MSDQKAPKIAIFSQDSTLIEIVEQVFADIEHINSLKSDICSDILIVDTRSIDGNEGSLIHRASLVLAEIDDIGHYSGHGDGQICLSFPIRAGELADAAQRLTKLYKNEHILQMKNWDFSPLRRSMTSAQGDTIYLTDKECETLSHIYQNAPVSKEDLMTKVWGYHKDSETHTIETHIYRLRQKIEKNPSEPEILVTEDSGYVIRF